MPKQAPWEIRVGRKTEVLAEFSVPAHKLRTDNVKAFLKAIVIRYRNETPEEMMSYYVNKTRGLPSRLPFADVMRAYDIDRCRVGYSCGDWECYAFAMQEISGAVAQTVKKLLEATKAANSRYQRFDACGS